MVTKTAILKALKNVMDPELGMNIVDLGFIYGVKIKGGNVHIKMTMTTPMCPLLSSILEDAKNNVSMLKGVKNVEIELVWKPRWTPKKISPEARKTLGL